MDRAGRATEWLDAAAARQAAALVGRSQSQVVSRRQLIAARVPRWVIRCELRAGRWSLRPGHVVVLHNGPLDVEARRWAAVLGTCPRAALAGVTALQASGVKGLDDGTIHVIAPRGSEPRAVPGVVVHESRRFREDDVVAFGVRRSSPAVAAVHAALWARTDRQAQLFVMMTVQQRKASVQDVRRALDQVRRHRRRCLLRDLLADLAGGVESLGELDVAADFRHRGFPEPDRQVVRRRPSGLEYLDVELSSYDLVFELDGAGHDEPEQKLADLLRDISVAADGQTVIRMPMSSYKLDRERVLDRIESLLRSRGWRNAA